MSELDQILADIESAEAASRTRLAWHPGRSGTIDIRIAADGSWHHEGRPFRRDALVRLFAGVLRREGDDYFLVTPAEKLRIEVEDAPFLANLVEVVDGDDHRAIVFTTNVGERVVVDAEHPLRVEIDPESAEPRPYVYLRNGLEALIGRSAFYDLLCLAEVRERDGARFLYVSSMGAEFELGRCDD